MIQWWLCDTNRILRANKIKTVSASISFLSSYAEKMVLPERLTIDPEILSGKPVIRNSRIAAEFVLELLAAGMSESEILDNYPGLQREDILACLTYASQLAHEWKTFRLSA